MMISPNTPQFQAYGPGAFTGPLRDTQEEALQDLRDRGWRTDAMVSKGSNYGALFDDQRLLQIVVSFDDGD